MIVERKLWEMSCELRVAALGSVCAGEQRRERRQMPQRTPYTLTVTVTVSYASLCPSPASARMTRTAPTVDVVIVGCRQPSIQVGRGVAERAAIIVGSDAWLVRAGRVQCALPVEIDESTDTAESVPTIDN